MVNHFQTKMLQGLKVSVGIQPVHVEKINNPNDRLLRVQHISCEQCYRMT